MTPLERSLMTIGCRDTDCIPKVSDAGKILVEGEYTLQLMHNGVRVIAGGYYGDWMSHVIRGLQGHHEPQEELLFHHLMRYVRNNSVMAELGAFWSYYTQWFLREIPGSRALCVEPDPQNLMIGERNAAVNGHTERARYVQAWIGGKHQIRHEACAESDGQALELPMFDMQAVFDECACEVIELLHMDAQGAELPFLQSMQSIVKRGGVRFLMVSTHHSSITGSTTTHSDCIEAIRSCGGYVLVEHDVMESFSGDGLILASFYACDATLQFPKISRNSAATSLFKSA